MGIIQVFNFGVNLASTFREIWGLGKVWFNLLCGAANGRGFSRGRREGGRRRQAGRGGVGGKRVTGKINETPL